MLKKVHASKVKPIYRCDTCKFTCSKNSNYLTHLLTARHKRQHNSTESTESCPTNSLHICTDCNRSYKDRSGLWRHKNKCVGKTTIVSDSNIDTNDVSKDVLIDTLVNELKKEREDSKEMKSMFMMMMEKYDAERKQNESDKNELLNKVISIIPTINNTNTTVNNTLNFYLTYTCKDAESIHDFTDRYIKKCVDFFTNKYRDVASNQISLASNVYEIFFKCLEANPQYLNFIQTTDVKNGVFYVKEKKKDHNRQLFGEAEFIKYVDGFEKAGTSIGHAMNKAFLPLKTTFTVKLEKEIGKPPNEDDYENEDEYEEILNKYKERKLGIGRCLFTHVYDATSLFDIKPRKLEILEKTKRLKDTLII
jgi:hypothetical protein